MRVLYVEDQKKLAAAVKKSLELEGFAVDVLHTGTEALQRIMGSHSLYDIVILDILLPEISGVEILKQTRARDIHVPILLLSALSEIEDRVLGLDTGADDYLAKPFATSELVARIRAVLRRPHETQSNVLGVRDITLDTKRRTVTKGSTKVVLTVKEFSMLEYIMRNKGMVMSREDILNHVWDYDSDTMSNVVDVHIKNIRKKLQKKNETIFETIHGIGYRCNP